MDKIIFFGFLRSSAYIEVIILAVFASSLQSPKQYKKIGLISLVLSGAIISISLLLYVMALEYKGGIENLSGLFELSRAIYYNRFFQRLESIFLFIWVLSSLITVSAAFFVAKETYAKTFKIKNKKPLILPLSILTFTLCVMPKNITEVIEINILIVRQYSLFIVFSIPIFVYIIALITRKKGGEKNAKKIKSSANCN
jgi:hypothetical protein